MNIKEWFKKKKNTFIKNEDIISALNVFPMPIREKFNNDELINFYKEEYVKKLHALKANDVLGLSAEELQKGIKMHIDFILTILNDTDVIKEKTAFDRLDYLIKCEQLDIYQSEIERMKEQATARLIALTEIRQSNIFLRRKRNIVDNEIETLYISLYILASQEYAIKSGINNYKNQTKENYNLKEEEKEEYQAQEYEALEEEINRLETLEQVLDEKDRIKIRREVNFVAHDVAMVRKNLSAYAYKHKDEGNKLKEDLKNLQSNNTISREERLKLLNIMEIKFLLFNTFGHNIINDDDIVEFYNYKFMTLSDENGLMEVFVNDKTDRIAKENYQKVILKMIDIILKGTNNNLINFYGDNYKKAINFLLEILKNGKETLDPDEILNNYYLLNFLITFYNNNLTSFWNIVGHEHWYENINGRDNEEFEIYWQDNIPLKSFLYVKYFKGGDLSLHHNEKIYNVIQSLSCFYYFYQQTFASKEYYYLPEGLKSISDGLNNDNSKKPFTGAGLNDRILDDIRKNSRGKVLILPPSLDAIFMHEKHSFLEKNDLKGINKENGLVLASGFSRLRDVDLSKENFTFLEVPSTINSFQQVKFNKKVLRKLIINNVYLNYCFIYSDKEEWDWGIHWLYDLFLQFNTIMERDGKYYLKSDFDEIVLNDSVYDMNFVFNQDLTTIEISKEEYDNLREFKSKEDLTLDTRYSKARDAILKLELTFYKQVKLMLKEKIPFVNRL